ncbi:MAG: sigma-70 family RNA polymerase sigma factor [Acidimicrobiia bacterium]
MSNEIGSHGTIKAIDTSSAPDDELVIAATSGDRDAFGALYDRYVDRIYDLCAHMLGDRTDAADATAEVFLAASDHLGQLRDPAKVRPWLYAIARNEVYKRTRRKRREVPVDHGSAVMTNQAAMEEPEAADPAALVGVVRDAALGLDERDRLVLELTLAGGLDGDDLADALGVSTDAAYQASHRMRERLARAVGAFIVARQGRADCDALQKVLAPWDGTFSVLWRKRVARHVDQCAVCEQRSKKVPAALFSGTAFAAVAPLVAPAAIRDRVMQPAGATTMAAATEPTSATTQWNADGFPKPVGAARSGRVAGIAAATAVAALLAVVLVFVATARDDTRVTTSPVTSSGLTTVPGPSSTSTTSASTDSPPGGDVTATTGTGVFPPSPTGSTPGTNGTATQPTAPNSSTTVPDRTGPSLSVTVPAELVTGTDAGTGSGCAVNPPVRATAADAGGVASVTMQYQGPRSGTRSLAPAGGNTWSTTWNPAAVGTYSVTITATDSTGNRSQVTRSVRAVACIG